MENVFSIISKENNIEKPIDTNIDNNRTNLNPLEVNIAVILEEKLGYIISIYGLEVKGVF